ncbi:MAG TPA: recombinase family protein [Candidatus Aphodoplasma excrementigallinarum]|uniref:Recombinase family protein n=1 Tax=Candidatus Aphodoplasma excrementigallinarum TaxID=2840673 RepID=A0A9D1NHZ7_9FIRM|nr:recombinase family protein [Candidatus Aphodoplasma excrementigallinarum]
MGFNVDPQSKRLVINPGEAEAVKIIFKMSLAGAGYSQIIRYLNANGYKTKRGQAFSKGSIHEILCNEKYTGTYVYNRIESPSIRVKGVVPQIISEDDFAKMAEIMKKRRHKAASYTAKETYLLSGKIICGECGSHYTGITRKSDVK